MLKKKIADGVRCGGRLGRHSRSLCRARSMPRRAGTASPSTCSTAAATSTTPCRCCRPSRARGDATPLVRVPWNDPGQIMRALDAGAMGIICPMINTKAEAEALVRSGRYPPMGERSFGPYRASQYGADYWQKANEEILLFAMVETRQAVNNLEEILSVKGINGVYVGPSDLSLSMGKPPTLDPTDKEVLTAIDIIVKTTRKWGHIAGVHTDGPATALTPLRGGLPDVHHPQRRAPDGGRRRQCHQRGARQGPRRQGQNLFPPPQATLRVPGPLGPGPASDR